MTDARPAAPRRRRKKRVFPKSTFLLFLGVAIIVRQSFFVEESDVAILVTGLVLCGFPIAEVADLFRNAIMRSWTEEGDPGA